MVLFSLLIVSPIGRNNHYIAEKGDGVISLTKDLSQYNFLQATEVAFVKVAEGFSPLASIEGASNQHQLAA
jgi:hypothetical protein